MTPAPRKKKERFSLAHEDEALDALVRDTDQKILAAWAIDCALRVLPLFGNTFPDDPRPQEAIATLRAWIATGIFRMPVIRGASLAAHAAARDAGEDSPARSAARAAGQAVATAHVPRHALGAALYAQQAVFRAAGPGRGGAAAKEEREWQYRHLLELRNAPESYER